MAWRLRHGTWITPEGHAGPAGAQTRKGVAIYPDGKKRCVYAGIPGTFFSIPAHGRLNGRYVAGWVGIDDTLDSPTHGALIFHIDTERAQ